MEIFKLFESTMANLDPGNIKFKDLRRDQLLDNYDAAVKVLETLIRAKESEIAYRKDLIDMLGKSKTFYDTKLKQSKQDYQTAKKHAPQSLDLKMPIKKTEKIELKQTSQPLPTPPPGPTPQPTISTLSPSTSSTSQQSSNRSSDLDIPLPGETRETRGSLDRRLSEFLKTFPNLTQAAPTAANNEFLRPTPGYYTQQQPLPPPVSTAPPSMDMLRFPPPNMMNQFYEDFMLPPDKVERTTKGPH